MNKIILDKYFFVLFSLIPVSIVAGSTISLINILLIVFSFLFYAYLNKEWNWIKHKYIKILLIFYLYLIFNSLIALDFSLSAFRNFGFIRFVILFAAFNYFFSKYEYFNKILFIWFIFLIFLTFDVYFESINGKNIIGYGEGDRIFSFFKDEPVVGGFITSFYLLTVGYLFEKSKNKNYIKNYLILLISCIFLLAIIFTGERSNGIKALIMFVIFYLLIDNFSIKQKIISLFLILVIFFIIALNSDFLKKRYYEQFIKLFSSKDAIIKTYNSIKREYFASPLEFSNNNKRQFGKNESQRDVIYFKLYSSGIEVFKRHLIFGVGNKNYGFETCYEKRHWYAYICSGHPHQTYIELLAEHGTVGTIIILSIIFYMLFQILKTIQRSKNKIQIAAFLFILISFVPLLPSGSFFGDYSITLFFINFSLMFAANKSSNIFSE